MQRTLFFPMLLVSLTCLLAGCTPAVSKVAPPMTSPEASTSTATPATTNTPAPTPAGFTSTPAWRTSTPVPTPSSSPTPTLPPQAEKLETPAGVRVILFLGTDIESPYKGRTDTVILVFVNSETGNVSLVSIPRDLFVYQPGEGMERLNTAYVYGDIDLLYKTLEYNFGVIPEHYVLVHFDDLFHFVNDLGGIEVKVDTPIWDKCGGIPKGMIHMGGGEALCYVRIRQEIGDFERNQRQQDVIRATLKNALRPRNIAQMPRLYQRYSATARSDFSFTDLLAFLPLALRLQDGAGIHSFHINREETTPWEIPETHASVLLPRQDKIRGLLQQAIHILEFPIPTSTALPTRLTALPATLTQMPYIPPPETPTPAPGGTPTPAP